MDENTDPLPPDDPAELRALRAEERLRRLERTLRDTQRVAHLGTWVWDIKANRVEWSDEMFRIFGVEPAGFAGDLAAVIARAIHPEDREAVERSNRSVSDHGAPTPIEYRVVWPDGSVRVVWAEAAELLRDADGAPAVLTGIVQDITERRRAESDLRDSEARHRRLVEAIPGVLYTFDVGHGGAYYSPQVEALLGYTAEHLRGNPMLWHDSVHPDDLAAVDAAIRQHPPNGIEIEYRIRDARGEWRWVLDRSVHLTRMEGVATIEGVVLDITARKQAEEALRRSEAQYRLLTERIKDVVWVLDAETLCFRYVSPSVERMRGFTPEEILAAPLTHALTREAEAHLVRLIRQRTEALLSGAAPLEQFYTEEVEQPCKDGSTVWTEVVTSFYRNPDDGRVEIRGVTRDISERKRAEAERAVLVAQLQQAQKIESVGRLAGGVAHDFNNMLGVILGYTDAALDQLSPSHPLHDDLEEVRKAAMRSADLTRQLLTFARKQPIAPKVLDLNATLTGMMKMLRRLIGENILLDWCPVGGVWAIHADPSQIDQMLANLCVNARDAISGVGALRIETGNCHLDDAHCAGHEGVRPGDYVKIVVRDDGCGMGEDVRAHLFEPFFTTKGVGSGTGLGLATVYGIVKQNQGAIDVASEPGAGTTITIYLPRYVADAPQAGRPESAAPAERGKETILVVEDEPAILKLTARMLQKLGYAVVTATTPGEAIRRAQEHAGVLHLVFTDVIMPEMNGRELVKRLLSYHPGLKRLFMSGYTADVIAHHGVLGEGVNFIQKPFSREQLAAKVREALDDEPAR
jgi:PAS domain S-box-containing protein